MSYILEAIKKADQKRKLGTVPDVSSEHGSFFADGRRSRWPYWAALALFVNAGLIGWWLIPADKEHTQVAIVADPVVDGANLDLAKHNEDSAQALPVDVQDDTEDESAVDMIADTEGSAEASQPSEMVESQTADGADSRSVFGSEELAEKGKATLSEETLASTPTKPLFEKALPADASSSKAQLVVKNQNDGQPDLAAGIDLAKNIDKDTVDEIFEDGGHQEIETLSDVAETLDSDEQELRVVGGLLTPEEEEAVAEDDLVEEYKLEKEKESDEKALERIPFYYQLPDTVQNKIPEIHISFHVYARRPSDRIVSVNGKVLREGQNLEKEIKLEQITPLGIVLLANNRRFKVEID